MKRRRRYASGVRSFLRQYLWASKNRYLGAVVNPLLEDQAARLRADHASELLQSSYFQEVIQAMNEEVVVQIAQTDPLDTATLTVLRLQLGSISDFVSRLTIFMDEYATIVANAEVVRERQRVESLYQVSESNQLNG